MLSLHLPPEFPTWTADPSLQNDPTVNNNIYGTENTSLDSPKDVVENVKGGNISLPENIILGGNAITQNGQNLDTDTLTLGPNDTNTTPEDSISAKTLDTWSPISLWEHSAQALSYGLVS